MSNRPKLQKARISNREMTRDTKQLVESGVQMCEILAFIHEAATAPVSGGPFKRYAQRKAALARIRRDYDSLAGIQGAGGRTMSGIPVQCEMFETGLGGYYVYADRLAIWRKDGKRLTWEELQAVKCAVWGDRVAVEVYPAQGDVVNLRHTRHLWTGPRLTEAVAAECTHVEFANKPGVGRRDSGSDVPHHPLVGGQT